MLFQLIIVKYINSIPSFPVNLLGCSNFRLQIKFDKETKVFLIRLDATNS